MTTAKELKMKIGEGVLDETLTLLYGAEQIPAQRQRYLNAIDRFTELFGDKGELSLFSAPGRTEIGGNHTDHNGGRVLAGSVDLDVIAVVAKTEDHTVTVHSEGFSPNTISLKDLSVKPDEAGKSNALLRGVAQGFLNKSLSIGGFIAYTESRVPKGSGVSSSAAFEVLLGSIFNHLYNNGKVSPLEIAKISQFAERDYFGKPCGLMDQAACAVGGIAMMDFADEKKPVVEPVPFDFASVGYKLCLVTVGGDHANLTHLYAEIPQKMKAVANFFGKEKLCELSYEEFLANLPSLRKAVGDMAVLAALHFLLDTRRVLIQREKLLEGDFPAFLHQISRSGHSSYEALQNVLISIEGADQGAALALNLATELLDGEGACRIHGGGFGGTTQNFVPNHKVKAFQSAMDAVFGEGACQVLSIRPVGPVKLF